MSTHTVKSITMQPDELEKKIAITLQDENLTEIYVEKQPFDKRLANLILVNGYLTIPWLLKDTINNKKIGNSL